MPAAVERIVLQTTAQDKQALVAKARRLDMPVSELMRRGAFACEAESGDAELAHLAEAAGSAAERAGADIGDALDFIAAMQAAAAAPAGSASPARGRTRKAA